MSRFTDFFKRGKKSNGGSGAGSQGNAQLQNSSQQVKKGNPSQGSSSKIVSAAPMTITPPSYAGIGKRYENLSEEVAEYVKQGKTHANPRKITEFQGRKARIDQDFTKAQGVTLGINQMMQLSSDKEKMEGRKKTADDVIDKATKKMGDNVSAHENLESYKGNIVTRLVKHASTLQEEDDLMEKDASKISDPQEKKQVEEQQAAIKAKRDQFSDKKKTQENKDEHVERAGLANTIMQYIGTIFGVISDGCGTLADMGVDTKKSADQLRASMQEASSAKDVGGVWWDEMKDPWTKGDTDMASASFSYMGAILALVGTIHASVEMGIAIGRAIKNKKEDKVDRQEQWADAREGMAKIADVYGSLIGAVAPFTSGIPILGPVLNFIDNGIQIVLGGVNLVSNTVHAVMMRHDKQALWEKIETKRKKYKGEEAAFFDIKAVKGGAASGADEGLKRNSSDIDTKRRELLGEVLERENKAAGKVVIAKKTSSSKARNFNENILAESSISTRISALREERRNKQAAGTLSSTQRDEYKKRQRAMEALELMSQYRTAEKAAKKMHKAVGHDVEGLITNGIKVVGNITSFVGELTAATGYGAGLIAAGTIVNGAEGLYEVGRGIFSKIYKYGRKKYGSEENKNNTRNEMAEYLFDKMLSVGPGKAQWAGDFFDLSEKVPDYKIREESTSMDELYSIFRRGLDLKVSTLLTAHKPKVMKKALAAAFSQDGAISFADDGI